MNAKEGPNGKTGITSHVLDLALGQPARGLTLRLDVLDGATWRAVTTASTDEGGRTADLLGGAPLDARTYRLTFETGAYFAATQRPSFYPQVQVTFEVTAPAQHHHLPLLLSPFGYSTYRGS
ncbi:MAG TPA: hydroxyisourate hydrolase [Polyangia bacterium]|nr:hydroxyisourate hydrolase [Polyangia bacterium]